MTSQTSAQHLRNLRMDPCKRRVVLLLAAVFSIILAAPAAAQRRLTDQIILEFDLPAEYWLKDRQGRFVVTGFLVGYFAGDGARPLHTLDVSRDAVALYDRVGRVLLPQPRLPVDIATFVLRLQTISVSGSSPWSAASPPVAVLTASARRGNSVAPTARAAKTPRHVTLDSVAQYPQLLAAIHALLPAADTRARVVERFGTMNELATAVVICQEQRLSLEQVSHTIAGPPRRNLRNAVRELKPRLRGTNVILKASPAARRLLEQKVPARD